MVLGVDWAGGEGAPRLQVGHSLPLVIDPPHWGPSLRSPRKERPGGVREEEGKQGVSREQAGPGVEERGSPGQGQLSLDLPVS